jgi:hypothetical protein
LVEAVGFFVAGFFAVVFAFAFFAVAFFATCFLLVVFLVAMIISLLNIDFHFPGKCAIYDSDLFHYQFA